MEIHSDTCSGLTSTSNTQQLQQLMNMPQVQSSTNRSINFIHPTMPCGYCDCHLNGCKFLLWLCFKFSLILFIAKICLSFQIYHHMKKLWQLPPAISQFSQFRQKHKQLKTIPFDRHKCIFVAVSVFINIHMLSGVFFINFMHFNKCNKEMISTNEACVLKTNSNSKLNLR